MTAGVGLDAGPDRGVVAEPPGDEPAPGRGHAAGQDQPGDDQPDGAADAPGCGGRGRGL